MSDSGYIIGREDEKDRIRLAIGGETPIPQHLHICGTHGTGKTMVVKSLIHEMELSENEQTSGIVRLYISSICVTSLPLLLDTLLSMLAEYLLRKKIGNQRIAMKSAKKETKCRTVSDFSKYVDQLVEGTGPLPHSVVVIIDDAEHLRSLSFDNFLSVMRFSEFSNRINICAITISVLPFSMFYPGHAIGLNSMTLFFKRYTKAQVLDILEMECKKWWEAEGELSEAKQSDTAKVQSLVRQFLHVYYQNVVLRTSNIQELKRMLLPFYKSYVSPVLKESIDAAEAGKLYSSVLPHFQNYNVAIQSATNRYSPALPAGSRSAQSTFDNETIQFLISAYVASHNEPTYDWKIFDDESKATKSAGTKRKRKRIVKSRKSKEPEEKQVHMFSIERLLAIRNAMFSYEVYGKSNGIESEKGGLFGKIFSVVATLEEFNYLVRISRDENLENPKYKCNVTEDKIKSVSRQIDFDIDPFLQ